MPNIKSAIKRMRQNTKRRTRNRVRKERLRLALKDYRKVLQSNDSSQITTGLSTVSAAIDRAGVKGILHKNAVNRRKSRLAKKANLALGSLVEQPAATV